MPDERSSSTTPTPTPAAADHAATPTVPPYGPRRLIACVSRAFTAIPRALEDLADLLRRHIHTNTHRHDDLVKMIAHIDERLNQMPTLADLQALGTKTENDIAAAVTELKTAIEANAGEIPQGALDVVSGLGASTLSALHDLTASLKPAPTPLPAVSDFAASATGNAGEILLAGTLPAGATSFNIFLNGSTTAAATGTSLPFTLSGQPSGTPVSVAIAAVDAAGIAGALSAAVSVTPA